MPSAHICHMYFDTLYHCCLRCFKGWAVGRAWNSGRGFQFFKKRKATFPQDTLCFVVSLKAPTALSGCRSDHGCVFLIQFPCPACSGFLKLCFQSPVNPVLSACCWLRNVATSYKAQTPSKGYGLVWICSNSNEGAALSWRVFCWVRYRLLFFIQHSTNRRWWSFCDMSAWQKWNCTVVSLLDHVCCRLSRHGDGRGNEELPTLL